MRNKKNQSFFFQSGAWLCFLAVAFGAFGAHGLRSYFQANPKMKEIFHTAVQYHFIHSLALLFCAWAVEKWPNPRSQRAGFFFLAGILLFSGSLYALSLSHWNLLGIITPIGGVAFLVGWVNLALAPRTGHKKEKKHE